jgi:hypothetical protein
VTLTFKYNAPWGDVKINGFYNGTWRIEHYGRIIINGWTNETNYEYFDFWYKFNDYNTLTMWGGIFHENHNLTTNVSGIYTRQ